MTGAMKWTAVGLSVAAAAYIAFHGMEGWGWFPFRRGSLRRLMIGQSMVKQ